MMRRYDTETLNSRHSLVDVVGRDVALRKVASTDGGEYAGPCPKCGGTDRFHVTRAWAFCRQCWPFGNGERHDAIAYLRWRDGLTFAEACEALGGDVAPGLSVPTRRQRSWVKVTQPPGDAWQARAREFVAYAQGQLWRDAEALAYLRDRGLSDDTIRAAHLGYNPGEIKPGDDPARWGLEGRRVYIAKGWVIPYESGGVIRYVKVRRRDDDLQCKDPRTGKAPSKYLPIRGSHPPLYGLDGLRGHTDALVCEGEYDCLLLRQHVGDLCGVAALGSATASLDTDTVAVLCGVRRVFVALDSDDPGQAGAENLAGTSARMRVIPPPGGAHDVTDAWKAGHDLAAWAVANIGPDDPDKRAAWATQHLEHLGEGALRDALRAETAARMANMPQGTNRYTRGLDRQNCLSTSQPAAAELLHVSTGSIKHAKVVQQKGVPALDRLARDRGGTWREIPAPDWAADLGDSRRWFASDDGQLVSIS